MEWLAFTVEHFTPSLDLASIEALSTPSLIWYSTTSKTILLWLLIFLTREALQEESFLADGALELSELALSAPSNTLKSVDKRAKVGKWPKLTRVSQQCSPGLKAC